MTTPALPIPALSLAERRWLVIATAVVLLLLALPTLLGFILSTPALQFTGITLGIDDGFSYLTKMRVGTDGGWLYTNRYATAPHPPALIYLYYLVFGKIAGPSVFGQALVYNLTRLLGAAAYLWLTYPLAALLLVEVWQRRLAWLLIHLGGGLGLLLILFTGQALPFGNAPFELYLNEAFSLHMLLALPHTPIARALLLGGFFVFLKAVHAQRWTTALLAGLLWLLSAIFLPLEIFTAGVIVGGLLLAHTLATRTLHWSTVALGLLAGLPGALYVVATWALMQGDPVYAAWNNQNLLPLPHPLHLLAAYGLPALIAAFGLPAATPIPTGRFLLGWLALNAMLPLIPLSFQLRFIEGLWLPLAILTAYGLPHLLTRLRLTATAAPRIAGVGLLVLLLPGSLLLYIGTLFQVNARPHPLFLPADQLAAYAWLDANASPGSILLSAPDTGLIAPARANLRVVIGHGFETPNYHAREIAVESFYANPTTSDLLTAENVAYVWFGPAEAELPNANPTALATLPNLAPVFQQGEFIIYQVQP